MSKERLFLHVCCGPCATVPLERLHDTYDIAGFFYDPNIQPGDEYTQRAAAARSYCHRGAVPFIEGPYDDADWERAVANDAEARTEAEGGKRCERCFRYRLDRTAREALERGYPWFGTTLTISPYKNTVLINSIGEELAAKYGLRFLNIDLKQDNGYQRSIELSKQAGLYRQKYCGCRFSIPRTKSGRNA